ncbi:subtilisin-like serine protease [Grosmannia clavigera kw1407]|uniref:Subtilisin-like serine protease n=1 Tax=Grosmannia clavigera (strain kw1407 / UAMH 11150) TaxID=655863 RepID=F0XB18_GROCL|nr:subtilisin-like serine protease [Grosmannia clavigera kw1407]EFX05069.1 subtilisin-like serine protease [Grosmannia clavigera kw1407]
MRADFFFIMSALLLVGIDGSRVVRRTASDALPDSKPSNRTGVAPNKFIVEVQEGADKQALIQDLESRTGNKVVTVFDSPIFNGFTVESSNENADTLQAIGAVAKTWHAGIVTLQPVKSGLLSMAGSSSTSASSGSSSGASNGSFVVPRAPKYSVHQMTGVDKLHEAGIYGKGAIVAMIDTGVQYDHEALGGCLGPGCKVAKGYDFVGDNTYWPYPGYNRTPDNDPNDQQGHGTHVAGIIAGNSSVITGVAPEATLYSYKVIGQEGGTEEDILIQAFLMAYNDGADIITASVGSDGGWSTDAWAMVASRLVEAGVVVTIAAGNSGDTGPFYLSSGASGENVLAIASVDNTVAVARPFGATFVRADGQANTTVLGYRSHDRLFPADVKGWPIVPISLDTTVTDDACEPLQLPTKIGGYSDLSHVVPLVRVGGCEDYIKLRNLHNANASWALYYMDDEPIVGWSNVGFTNTSWSLISKNAGQGMVDVIAAGGNVTVDFATHQNESQVAMEDFGGGLPSSFTSWGATFDLTLKPDIAAPGGHILSSYISDPGVPANVYHELSGTSMATPYVAGVAALYIGQHGSLRGTKGALNLHARIISSGRALPWADGTGRDFGHLAPPLQVGGGLLDAVAVLDYHTQISSSSSQMKPKISLNDTHHFSRYHDIDIVNTGPTDLEYTFDLEEAGGFESYWTAEAADQNITDVPRIKDLSEIEPFNISTPVTLPQGSFVVPAGQTKKAHLSFDIPDGLNATRMPVWSGKVVIKASNGEQLSVPYFGVGASIEHIFGDVWYSEAGFPYSMSGLNKTRIEEKSTYTFNLSLQAQDFPKIRWVQQWASTELRWDIFDASYNERQWNYPPVVGQGHFVGSVTSFDWQQSTNYPNFDPATDNPNNTVAYPMHEVLRDDVYEAWWLGQLANGSTITPGTYKMRFAVLKPFGDPTHSDNWSIWKTPDITVE